MSSQSTPQAVPQAVTPTGPVPSTDVPSKAKFPDNGLMGTPLEQRIAIASVKEFEAWQRKVVVEELAQRQAAQELRQEPSLPLPTIFNVPTSDIVADLLRRKKLKLPSYEDKSTISTYEKNFSRITRKFQYLPLTAEPLLAHLESFTGDTGRTRRNEYDYLNQLYKHAKRVFGLVTNPMEAIDRPVADEADIRSLSWDEVVALEKTPESIIEKAGLQIFLGHGWRQIEARRIRAGDVRRAADGLIFCRGKERKEDTPLLPETLDLLLELASNLADNEPIFRDRRGRNEPLGADGMRDLVYRLYGRAGISDYKGHDLRKTFSQLAVNAGCEYFETERLLRHIIPGSGDRYFKYPMNRLVKALLAYSSLRLIKQKPVSTDGGVCTAGRGVNGGDGGELNSPSRRGSPEYATSLVGSLVSSG